MKRILIIVLMIIYRMQRYSHNAFQVNKGINENAAAAMLLMD